MHAMCDVCTYACGMGIRHRSLVMVYAYVIHQFVLVHVCIEKVERRGGVVEIFWYDVCIDAHTDLTSTHEHVLGHAHMHTRTRKYIHAHTSHSLSYMHRCTHVFASTHEHIPTHAHMHAHTRKHTHINSRHMTLVLLRELPYQSSTPTISMINPCHVTPSPLNDLPYH